jgi:hypothetical protein
MADACQATFLKGEYVIHCDSRWGCCQREQARQKVEKMNEEIAAKGGSTQKSAPMNSLNSLKEPVKKGEYTLKELTNKARGDMSKEMREMKKSERADKAEERGSAKCLVEAMRGRNPPKTQNDHELDVTLCGKYNSDLVPTDAVVNGMIGGIVGNQKVKPGTKITNIVLVCPKTDKCPDASEGTVTQKPTPRGKKPISVGIDRTTPFRSY